MPVASAMNRTARRLAPVALACLLMGVAVTSSRAADDDRALRAELAAHVRSGDDEALLRATEAALALDPDSIPALAHRAFALERLGKIGEARQSYEALLEQSPEHVWGLTRLAALHMSERRWEAAIALLRRAVDLTPSDQGAQRELVRALRGAGEIADALDQLRSQRDSDASIGWAWRETSELEWTQGNIDAAWEALEGAERLGADDLERLREVITLDRRMLVAADEPDALRAMWKERHIWKFDVGSARVRTSVGPRLPGDIVRMVRELPERFARVVGDDRDRDTAIVLRISRTLEEHERVRRVLFPQGSPGRAFTVSSVGGGWRGGAVAAAGEVTIYLAWANDDVQTSLAHELAHAALRGAAQDVPSWLDEGVATYLEKLRHSDDDVELSREDLERPLRAALREGREFAWTRMMAAQSSDFLGKDGRLRYAQAWSVVRFLLHSPAAGSDPQTRSNRFVRALRTGNRLQGARVRGPGRGGWADWTASLEEIYESPMELLEAAWRKSLE